MTRESGKRARDDALHRLRAVRGERERDHPKERTQRARDRREREPVRVEERERARVEEGAQIVQELVVVVALERERRAEQDRQQRPAALVGLRGRRWLGGTPDAKGAVACEQQRNEPSRSTRRAETRRAFIPSHLSPHRSKTWSSDRASPSRLLTFTSARMTDGFAIAPSVSSNANVSFVGSGASSAPSPRPRQPERTGGPAGPLGVNSSSSAAVPRRSTTFPMWSAVATAAL